ncbi:MAG: 5'/3'-nucleotidase SurE [Clostridia bacterium]|nr:5'/3'-nucleotidase SurE [Clostridia bacterium]
MRILITNDDGIFSPVLPRLVRWAQKLGEVVIVAPKVEQSAKSQGIEIRNAVEIKKVLIGGDIEAYAMDSTPADCVRFGVLGLGREYDLVISGINRGFNVGHDISYSGTVAAILEGSRLGVKGLAISTDPQSFDDSVERLDAVWKYICKNRLFELNGLYNVNIPLGSSEFKVTHQGGMYFSDAFECRGEDMYIQVGAPVTSDEANPNSDISAICNGLISVTPITAHKTDFAVYEKLKDLNL